MRRRRRPPLRLRAHTAADPPVVRALPPSARTSAKVLVTVVDGDTHGRVRGARVVIGRRAGYANATGLAAGEDQAAHGAPGSRLEAGVRDADRADALQAAPAGDDSPLPRLAPVADVRRQLPPDAGARATSSLRPPFKVVWSRGIGDADRVPRRRHRRRCLHRQLQGHDLRADMRNGKVIWKYDPPGGKMASSPAIVGDDLVVHGMDGIVRVLDRGNGRLRWRFRVGSPIESSPIVHGGLDYFGAWNGRVYALDLKRRKLRWSYRAAATRSRRAPRSPARRSTSATTAAGCSRSPPAPASCASRARSTAASTGRRRSRPGASSSPPRPATASPPSRRAAATSGGCGPAATSTRPRRSGPAASSSARTTAASTPSPRSRGGCSGASARAGRCRARRSSSRGVAYAGSTWGRITGVDAKSGRVVLRFPHGEYVPVSGNGRRLLLHGYSRVWAVEPKA